MGYDRDLTIGWPRSGQTLSSHCIHNLPPSPLDTLVGVSGWAWHAPPTTFMLFELCKLPSALTAALQVAQCHIEMIPGVAVMQEIDLLLQMMMQGWLTMAESHQAKARSPLLLSAKDLILAFCSSLALRQVLAMFLEPNVLLLLGPFLLQLVDEHCQISLRHETALSIAYRKIEILICRRLACPKMRHL